MEVRSPFDRFNVKHGPIFWAIGHNYNYQLSRLVWTKMRSERQSAIHTYTTHAASISKDAWRRWLLYFLKRQKHYNTLAHPNMNIAHRKYVSCHTSYSRFPHDNSLFLTYFHWKFKGGFNRWPLLRYYRIYARIMSRYTLHNHRTGDIVFTIYVFPRKKKLPKKVSRSKPQRW